MAGTANDTQVIERTPPAAPTEATRTGIESAAPRGSAQVSRGAGAVPPGGLGVVGVLTALVGAWGGIVAFVGPSFGFDADGTVSWYWNLAHAVLWLAPGAVACFAGLVMVGLIPRALVGLARLGSATTGFLAAVSGAWFVIGPTAWPVLRHSGGVFAPAGPLRELSYQVGYSLGPGILLAVSGAFAMGWAVRSRRVRRDATEAVPARTAPA